MTINIGDEVYLTNTMFNACPGYPVIGTKFECAGIVAEISPTKALIHWKDGTFCTFNKIYLTKTIDIAPTRCKSIW